MLLDSVDTGVSAPPGTGSLRSPGFRSLRRRGAAARSPSAGVGAASTGVTSSGPFALFSFATALSEVAKTLVRTNQ